MDSRLPGSRSMGFSRQEYWSRLPFPSPGDLPNPGIESRSPALQTDTLLSEPLGKPHVWMWELKCKEGWVLKNWRFWTVVLEKTLESPLDCKEIQPVHPKGNQSWMFIGRADGADVEAETPILWPSYAKNWLIWKDADDGKDQRQEKKGTTKDEMVGWYHQMMDMSLSKEGQGSLVCCSPWGRKELDTTEWLN